MTPPQCYSTGGACAKAAWAACGYEWLILGPVGLIWACWFFLGLYMLYSDGSLHTVFRFDTKRIHDPLSQGIAIALSQRKYESNKQPRVLRYVKLCAMWAEWPTFSMTPLTLAYKVAGTQGYLEEINLAFNTIIEVATAGFAELNARGVNLTMAVVCCGIILLLRRSAKSTPQADLLLRRYMYPITFDALYIPLVATFVRLGTCPQGLKHISLPGGATCECVDRFGIFWAVGLIGFILLYASSLYYKMYIEPLGTTMDFRFETSFQIIMVMARTLNPILSVLAIGLELQGNKTQAIPMTAGFLFCVTFLLYYAYRTQPCIGSGRFPNNIRVLSFSSSLYTTICVLAYFLSNMTLDHLYASLLPLPLVWASAWRTNSRRAALFDIPDLSILELLQQRTPQAKTVGTIAALHMDASKVRQADHEAIIFHLHGIAKHSMLGTPLCRIYAIRTLWFCYIRNFRKGKGVVGEPNDNLVIPTKLWFKDRDNTDRAKYAQASLHKRAVDTALVTTKKRIKPTNLTSLWRFNVDIIDTDAVSVRQGMSKSGTLAALLLKKSKGRAMPTKVMDVDRHLVCVASDRHLNHRNYHMIRVRDKHWICKNEETEAATVHHEALHQLSLEVLSQSCAMDDRRAMHEIATFLLQWYKARYLRLNKTVYLHLLSTLCATHDLKGVIDATYTLHKLCTDGFMPLELWLQNTSFLNNFVLALGHPSGRTVFFAADLLAAVLALAETDAKTNLFVLLTPESIAKLHGAFRKWCDVFNISDALERCCLSLHRMEELHQRKLWQGRTASVVGSRSKDRMSFLKPDKSTAMYDRSRWLSMASTTDPPLSEIADVMSARDASLHGGRKIAIVHLNPGTVAPSTATNPVQQSSPSRSSVTRPPANTVSPSIAERGTSVSITRKASTVSPRQPEPANGAPSLDSVRGASFEKADYIPSHRESKISTLSRLRRVSMDLLNLSTKSDHRPGHKPEQFLFVTTAIIKEIHRRRALRRRFEDELQRTYYMFEELLLRPVVDGPDWLKDKPTRASAKSTTGRQPANNGVLGAFATVMEIYTTTEECAMHDFVNTMLDRDLVSFFENHIKPFMTSNSVPAECFWAGRANDSSVCSKALWPSCGYSWLVDTPVLLLFVYWIIYGVHMMRRHTSLLKVIKFDTQRIHDPVAQAQRKTKHKLDRRSNIQHNMKLCAMWAEWPSLTYAPLSVALKVADTEGLVNPLVFSLNFVNEVSRPCVAGRDAPTRRRTLLRRFAYPMVFDVLYIPLTSTFLRMAVCPHGYDRLALPSGATCDCLDYYGGFWAIGGACFVAIYSGAVYYKIYIEPFGTTMDFRFETSFQITMVMARTCMHFVDFAINLRFNVVNPLLSMLANSVGLRQNPGRAVPLTLAFLASLVFLLVSAYKTQPCIGSGRIPNNIRVLTFSSSFYTTLCVIGLLVSHGDLDHLYMALTPLPLVWALAWWINDRRARKFHIPNLTIVELLHERTEQAKTVGAIAALHMNPLTVDKNDHEAIIALLNKIIKLERVSELRCRIICARVVWFCHIESFRRAKTVVGEPNEDLALPPKLWFKDIANPDRGAWQKIARASRQYAAQTKRVKIRCVEFITGEHMP
ncbi:hypothetical protein ACHHYP_02819 [Achlya hypogyna]|uniref:Transmembrane protein n=1 Tax=Achlya hypogyna TaxID=1202772 RepID=A0A1V9ZRS1_ACHHY|nr:hypothetical protein ACHHYP_02819 [Achlya hypogyna]